MKALRPVGLLLAVAGVGFAGTLAAGAGSGLHPGSLLHLAALIAPALAVTVIATGVAGTALGRSSIRVSTAAVAVVGAASGLANLAALASLMVVSRQDATLLGVLLVYATGAGVGAALAFGSARARAIDRLAAVARELGKGTLTARVGPLASGPELEMLARTLDDMAGRLQDAMARERMMEARRRDLMTAISHDLRTPLSSLRAMVEAIGDRVVDDAQALRAYTAEMRRAVIHLATMVDDLFELAQLETGAIDADTARAKLADVVRSAVAAVEFQAADRHLSLREDLGGLGGTACSPRLARVLQDLLANAIRHTPADGTVLIEARQRQAGLEVAVEDNGEGIRPEDLPRIFEPFYRADPARAGPGAGLGLALANRITKALGGHLDVESKPQAGARFTIRVPMAAAAGELEPARPEPPGTTALSRSGSGPLHASLPAITAGEPFTGIILGIMIFGDQLQSAPGLVALQAAGLVALVTGVIAVARGSALTGARTSRPRRPRARGPDRRRPHGPNDPDELSPPRPPQAAGSSAAPALSSPSVPASVIARCEAAAVATSRG